MTSLLARGFGLAFGVFVVGVTGCGHKAPPPPPPAAVSTRCPDLAKADEVAVFDFAKEYALSHEAADKLKAAALASIEIFQLGDKLDAELGIACAQIAHDLGDKGDWRSGNDACAAALKAMKDSRARLGGRISTQLVVRTPICMSDAGLMTKCASICDSSVPADRVKAECERKVGRCDGNCEGLCEAKSVKCDGQCTGTCEGTMRGSCAGRCKGTCDGRPSHGGACTGVCAGTCEKGAAAGDCKGQCTGSCKMKAPGICGGLCAGTCTVELSDTKCAGEFKTPDVSTDCRARCELAVLNQTECSLPQAGLLVVAGPRERDHADNLKAAVDKSFPGLLKVLFEVGDKGGSRVLNAQAVIEGARKGVKDMARSGGAGSAASSEAQLTKCFDEPFKKAEAAAASIKTGIDEALAVRDAATK